MEGDADAYESYLEVILDNIPAGIVFIDENGNTVYKNKMAIDAAAAHGNILEDPSIKQSGYFEKLMKEGKPFRNIIWGNNSFSVDGIPAPGGGAILFITYTGNTAEKTLNENKERYRILTENSPSGIAIIKDGRCVFSNRKFGEITGYGKDGTEKVFSDFLHAGDVNLVMKKMNDALKGKKSSPCTVRLIRKDGGTAWVELDVCAVDYGRGKELLVNMVDITEKKRMEDELKISNKKMEEIMERERRFTEDISHYFFNPLCIAKGYIDLSMKEANPELKRKLEITRTAVDRVETVVKHVVMEGKIYE